MPNSTMSRLPSGRTREPCEPLYGIRYIIPENATFATAIGAGLCNVFEQVAIPDHLELNYIKSIMMSYGAYGAQMTGSGSAVYGLFDSFEYAAVACTMLKDNYPQVFIAKTV